jgi:hypothetical protein
VFSFPHLFCNHNHVNIISNFDEKWLFYVTLDWHFVHVFWLHVWCSRSQSLCMLFVLDTKLYKYILYEYNSIPWSIYKQMLLEQVHVYINWMDEMLNNNAKEFQRMLFKNTNQICCKYYNLNLMTYWNIMCTSWFFFFQKPTFIQLNSQRIISMSYIYIYMK